jgi:hypothetical protein
MSDRMSAECNDIPFEQCSEHPRYSKRNFLDNRVVYQFTMLHYW